MAKRYRKNNVYPTVPSGTVGAIHELMVACDLLRRGCKVYRSLTPNGTDLAVVSEGFLYTVEVTTGSRSTTGRLIYPKHDPETYDVIGVVVKEEEEIAYFTPRVKGLFLAGLEIPTNSTVLVALETPRIVAVGGEDVLG